MEAAASAYLLVIMPTTPPVPTNNASQPALSMIRACAAVGGCMTARTLSCRWIKL